MFKFAGTLFFNFFRVHVLDIDLGMGMGTGMNQRFRQ